jgi:penicillin amidase
MPTPPTNLVCADAEGNVAFRIAIFAPKRNGWDGRLPVPGTGKYEWAPERRFDLPSVFNPAEGFIATANNNTQPRDIAVPYTFVQTGQRYRRHERLVEMIKSGRNYSIDDMTRMLRDNYNSDAAENKIYFQNWKGESAELERARAMIEKWDSTMNRESAAAALYITWQRNTDMPALRQAQAGARAPIASAGLKKAIDALTKSQGADWDKWQWGRMNRSEFPHPLVAAYDLPAVERHGGAGTVNAIGAVYRLVTDFANPDNSRVTIAPGISGQPGSPFYSNLLELWGNNEFFPLLFTREAVEAKTKYRLVLLPGQS